MKKIIKIIKRKKKNLCSYMIYVCILILIILIALFICIGKPQILGGAVRYIPFPKTSFLNLSLTPDFPLSYYRNIRHGDVIHIPPGDSYKGVELKNVKYQKLHWGQRKLLMAEISFLTQMADLKCKKVVYAGAAVGTHILLLSDLFPDLEFDLYDMSKFDERLKQNPKIHINPDCPSGMFTETVASKYKDQPVLFMSDIRSGSGENHEEYEKFVIEDQEEQKKWILAMRPKATMLKFRLPYLLDKYEYFDGDIQWQVWGPVASPEVRLVFRDIKFKTYKPVDLNEQSAYFNLVLRNADFPNFAPKECPELSVKKLYPGAKSYGADYCLESIIWCRYMKLMSLKINDIHKILHKCLEILGPWSKLRV